MPPRVLVALVEEPPNDHAQTARSNARGDKLAPGNGDSAFDCTRRVSANDEARSQPSWQHNREAGCWVEADPTKTGEVSLHPTVGIVPLYNPYLALRIKMSLAEAIHYTSRDTQKTSHHHHSAGIVGAVATTVLEQPINNIDIPRHSRVIHRVREIVLITQVTLEHL